MPETLTSLLDRGILGLSIAAKRAKPESEDGMLSVSAMEAAELALILEGIELAGARRRPRWEPRRAAYRDRDLIEKKVS